MHALLLRDNDTVAQNLVELHVELPHISLSRVGPNARVGSPSSFSGTSVGSRVFSGLHLVLLMALPPKLPSMRVVASRVLVQLGAKRSNINSFHSTVAVPQHQLKVVSTIHPSISFSYASEAELPVNGQSVDSDTSYRQPTALELLCLVSEDKDAEIIANAVICMLHLSVDPRTLRDLIGLRVIPKILSVVGAASANEAVQFRAMLARMIATMCAKMSTD